MGLTKQILLDVNVTNAGENAYDTRCFLHLPAGVGYVSANTSSMVSKHTCSLLLTCFLSQKMNLYCNMLKQSDRIVVCQLGNPLLANANVSDHTCNRRLDMLSLSMIDIHTDSCGCEQLLGHRSRSIGIQD